MGAAPPLKIESPEAKALALELSELTGESVSEAVVAALRERLEQKRLTQAKRPGSKEGAAEEMKEIARRWAAAPELDPREPDDILYDKDGLIR